MRYKALSLLAIASILLFQGCGSKEGSDAGGASAPGLSTVVTPYSDVLQAAGFRTIAYKRFPAQVPSRKGHVIVYRSASRPTSGGVLYTNTFSDESEAVLWHWYFDDLAPDSVAAVETNDDGLWDVRFYFSNGSTEDQVQDTDFTFIARGRHDMVAMNGDTDNRESLWRAFDGDSISVWKSPGESWVEVPVPTGLKKGTVSVQLGREDQPASMTVKVDGKKVADVKLEKVSGKQVFELGPEAAGGKTVRLEFKPADGGAVAVSEISVS